MVLFQEVRGDSAFPIVGQIAKPSRLAPSLRSTTSDGCGRWRPKPSGPVWRCSFFLRQELVDLRHDALALWLSLLVVGEIGCDLKPVADHNGPVRILADLIFDSPMGVLAVFGFRGTREAADA